MTIDVKKNVEEAVITLEGRLDTTTAPALDKVITEEISGVSRLVLELKELEYISSAGLRVLLSAHKKMKQSGGTMTLKNVCENVMEVFDMTGFADILTIE